MFNLKKKNADYQTPKTIFVHKKHSLLCTNTKFYNLYSMAYRGLAATSKIRNYSKPSRFLKFLWPFLGYRALVWRLRNILFFYLISLLAIISSISSFSLPFNEGLYNKQEQSVSIVGNIYLSHRIINSIPRI